MELTEANMNRREQIWHITSKRELPSDEAQIYLPIGDLTQSDERHLGAPIVLFEKATGRQDVLGRRFPIFGYYLSNEPNLLLEKMAMAHLIFQGLWVMPIQEIIEEEKDSTGRGLPFNDGSFTYDGQLHRIEVTGAYPRYSSGANLREMYARASSRPTGVKPQIAPRLECLTCHIIEDVYVGTLNDPVPHYKDHCWTCWFPPGWPGSEFPKEPIARLSPIDDSPKAMSTAINQAISSKANGFRRNPITEPVCLIVMTQGFPIPRDEEWIADVLNGLLMS